MTCLPEVATLIPFAFSTSAIVAMGRVRDRVIALEGVPTLCPTAYIVCAADHRAWNGRDGGMLLQEIAKILESGQLVTEVSSCSENLPKLSQS